MKLIKQIAFGAMLTFSAFCAVIYSSCSKDKCKDVSCQNDGVCSGGTCTCPIGVTGTNCETVYRSSFANNYKGNVTYSDATGAGSYNDYHLVFTYSTDTTYYKMSLAINDSSNINVFSFPVILSNFGTAGTVLTIPTTTKTYTGGIVATYTGTGTITGTIANLVLTESSSLGTTIYTFTNFAKQ